MKENSHSLEINNFLTNKDFGVILWNYELEIIYCNDINGKEIEIDCCSQKTLTIARTSRYRNIKSKSANVTD